jgi:hypothetical protein
MCTSVIFARTCEHGDENRVGVKICREDRPSRPDGGGGVQRAARRVLLLFGTATTADVIDYAYALRLLMLRERRRNWFNRVEGVRLCLGLKWPVL